MSERIYELPFKQSWLTETASGFNPGQVRVKMDGDSLAIEAHLVTPYIQDPPAKFNDLAFTKGDVLEVFLRADGDDYYHEVHVTPSNVLLQLRYPCDDVKRTLTVAEASRVWEPILADSSTERTSDGWSARVVCKLSLLTQQRPVPKKWHAAFCRYDYPEDGGRPVYSSTAPLTMPNFHRYREWSALDFS